MPEEQDMQTIVNLYATCMEEVKKRTEAIRMVHDKKYSTPFSITNTEFMALQLRKILELIALGNLVANREQYETVRASFQTDWNAKAIIKTIKKINTNYFPIGVIRKPSKYPKVVCEWENKTENILTEELFEKAYDEMSCLLHSKNPFSNKEENLNEINLKILLYMNLIINLLNEHTIKLCNGDILNCTMEAYTPQKPETKKVSVHYFGRISDTETKSIISEDTSQDN